MRRHHTENQRNTSRRQTRSEVWGTDPIRRSERINNKVLIAKTTSDAPAPHYQAYEDAMESPEGQQWKDAMDTNWQTRGDEYLVRNRRVDIPSPYRVLDLHGDITRPDIGYITSSYLRLTKTPDSELGCARES